MRYKDIADDFVIPVEINGQSTAGSTDLWIGPMVPVNCTVQSCDFTPAAAITANGTNFATLEVRNGGATGAGVVPIATRSYAATNSVAQTTEAVALNGTAANLQLTKGDHIVVNRAIAASGLATPQGVFNLVCRARS